jgi:hypothetical protein
MGALFSKKKSRVSAHDKAVLDLKVQRDRLTQYQKRVRARHNRSERNQTDFFCVVFSKNNCEPGQS